MDAPGAAPLIDRFLPEFSFSERHDVAVAAGPETVLRAVRDVTPGEMPLLVLLMALRALPARLRGRGRPASDRLRPVLDVALGAGFIRLAEDAPRQLVVGAAGRFWTLTPAECVRLEGPDAFRAFAAPDHVKAAMDFRIAELAPGRCRLSTETRIAATDAGARRKFALYWLLIHPGSALIRRAWLRAIKRRAERAQRGR